MGRLLVPEIDRLLAAGGATDRATVKAVAWAKPFLHLRAVFDPVKLPDTPVAFIKVPDVEGTLLARASAIAALAALELETISYGSENSGELFVNLVVIPGEGREAEKSQGGMRGHTDGVAFPIRGHQDPGDPRIAPSPDFVCLATLRNPNAVATNVIPLKDVLAKLPQESILELQKPQYIIGAQHTFRKGMRAILGYELMLDDAQVLFSTDLGYWIRYSHSSTQPAESGASLAKTAMVLLEEECPKCAQPVSLEPGDIVLVNNRIGLHGRDQVGDESGGTTRWLLRTYGLDTAGMCPTRRHVGSPYKLFP
ncbi:TPA: taurine catabolism dioxygenase TauD [Pseudomonas aeruginosa]